MFVQRNGRVTSVLLNGNKRAILLGIVVTRPGQRNSLWKRLLQTRRTLNNRRRTKGGHRSGAIWRTAPVSKANCPEFPPFRRPSPLNLRRHIFRRQTPKWVSVADRRPGSRFSGIGLSMTVTFANWNVIYRPWGDSFGPDLDRLPGKSGPGAVIPMSADNDP